MLAKAFIIVAFIGVYINTIIQLKCLTKEQAKYKSWIFLSWGLIAIGVIANLVF